MANINKLDRKTMERILKVYSYENDFNYVLKLCSVNAVCFLYSLKFYSDINDDFEDIVKFVSLNNEEKIYSDLLKEGVFNATTTNTMIKARNKKRYDIKTNEEIEENIQELDERLNRLLGK